MSHYDLLNWIGWFSTGLEENCLSDLTRYRDRSFVENFTNVLSFFRSHGSYFWSIPSLMYRDRICHTLDQRPSLEVI